ncbi:hypothetical protein GPA10_28225 [Streptomyces sp. p1417]|uniref:Uncharacterized protein n=1 Tax=Streptomyces typhae TaxID=2681492 RepID=A0A6L6X3Z0_9ACTN|nr:hypothetical protein [Streptomyces typhae]MVO88545.1 hypothetical protein [Streptomyces typhae]
MARSDMLAAREKSASRGLRLPRPHIEAHRSVPQTAVLAHADAFVTRTGMNSRWDPG